MTKNRIKELLKKEGETYEWLARKLDVTLGTIKNWVHNQTHPSYNYCLLIKSLFKLDRVEDIFKEDKKGAIK